MFARSIESRLIEGARGRFVVIVGPDGSGKTTLASAVIDRAGENTAYFHFLPVAWHDRPPKNGSPPPAKKSPDNAILGWLRLVRNLVRAIVSYRRTVRPAVAAGTFVVADRWVYGYVGQPEALRFSGPGFLARAMVRLLPTPDLVINLAAPAEVVVSRKAELTAGEATAEMARWARLPVASLLTLDASDPVDVLARRVLEGARWP